MTAPTPLTCGSCGTTDEPVRVNGLLTDPPGWSCITVSGKPIVNKTLCPPCTDRVRAALASVEQMSDRAAGALLDFAIADAELRGHGAVA